MNEKHARYIIAGTTVLESILASGFALDAVSKILEGRYKEAGFEVGLSLYFGAMAYLGVERFQWVYKTSPELVEQQRKAREEMIIAANDLRDYSVREIERLRNKYEDMN